MFDAATQPVSPKPARWRLTATVLWSVLLLVGFDLLGGVIVKILIGLRQAGVSSPVLQGLFGETLTLQLGVTLFVMLLGSACVVAIIALKKGSSFVDYLALRGVRARVLLRWIGLLLLFLVAESMLFGALGKQDKFFVDNLFAKVPPWLALTAVIVVAPVFEEITFRGFIFSGLEASFIGPYGAIGITAAVWAFFHPQYGVFGTVVVFALGVLFGFARLRSGSLVVPLVLHSLHNLSAFTLYSLLH